MANGRSNATRIVLAAAILAAGVPEVRAAESEEKNEQQWAVLLRQQLSAEKACDIDEILTYDEFTVGDGKGLSGQVQCQDGRLFDFSRNRENQKFDIRLCEPAVC